MEDVKEQSKNEFYERAGAFEELVRTKGWEWVKAYYQTELASFINDLFNNEDKPIADFEFQRRELMGLKKLLTTIDADLQELERLRKEKNGQPEVGKDE